MELLQLEVLAFCFGFGVIYLVGVEHLPLYTWWSTIRLRWDLKQQCNQLAWGP
jgi:hypothetical protein